jgi:hypothetical protein
VARALPFLADAASLCSIGALLAMRAPFQQARPPGRSPLRERVAEGFRFLLGQPFLRTCAVLFGLSNFIGPGVLLDVSARAAIATFAASGLLLAVWGTLSPAIRAAPSLDELDHLAGGDPATG